MQIHGTDEQFIQSLKEHSLRVTPQRMHIFRLLNTSGVPLTIQDIIHNIPSVNFVTVYRTLETLIAIGVVHAIPTGLKYSYELSDQYRIHHHHIVCNVCGKSIGIQDDIVEQAIQTAADHSGMRLVSHIFELRGVCKQCDITQ